MGRLRSPITNRDECPYRALKGTNLFSKIPDETLSVFNSAAQARSCPKGQIIYLEEDPAEFFYIIEHGWVKLFHETLDGEEAVMDILTTGHIFGEDTVFNNNIYKHSSQAVEDTELLVIPTSLLRDYLHKDHTLALAMLSSMSQHRRRQDREIEHLSIQNASQRIGCFLLRLIPKNKEKNIVIDLPYDKTLLAARLGMQLPTFSRALNTLRQATHIRISGARIEVDDIHQLSDFSCSACSSSYPCSDIT
jgi:CRP/FNR family transcriptional regulator, dissimilatory nitrate respiration regulator